MRSGLRVMRFKNRPNWTHKESKTKNRPNCDQELCVQLFLVATRRLMAAEPADPVLAGTSSHSVVSVSHPVRPPPAACLKLLLRSALRQRAQAVPIDKAAGFLYSKRSKAVADPELDAPPSPIRARPPPNAPVMPATDGLPGRPRTRRHERPTRRGRVPLLASEAFGKPEVLAATALELYPETELLVPLFTMPPKDPVQNIRIWKA